ncbi:MAG: hypothetical protein QGH60_19245 [Phycisphaerae bacterium]|nr:hypothetical protein [Phycisphaerae bacterium]
MTTAAYITAGLPVQDTSTPEPPATTAGITAGLPAAERPHTGYHLYVTQGSLVDTDFQADPAAVIPAGQASGILVGSSFAPSRRYTLVLRPVIDDAETPDISCRCEFETTAGGQWLGLRPSPVEAASAEVLSGGQVTVSWTYRIPEGGVRPEDFAVYHASGPEITAGDPQATVSYERDGVQACTLSLVGGQTYFFGVTARGASGVESHVSPVVGPVVADSSAPMTPPVILTTTF